jgi:hypothetical protein
MADNYYSDQFATYAQTVTARAAGYRAPASIGLARNYYKKARMNLDSAVALINDVYVLFKQKSSDCVHTLTMSCDGLGTALILDVGIYLVNVDGTIGTVQDINLFASGIDPSTAAVDRGECLTQVTLLGTERGLPLWQQLALGAGTDTVDPKIDYYIAAAATTALTTADTVLTFELEFTMGN